MMVLLVLFTRLKGIPGARSTGGMNFERWRLISLGFQYGNFFFLSCYWRLKFWCRSWGICAPLLHTYSVSQLLFFLLERYVSRHKQWYEFLIRTKEVEKLILCRFYFWKWDLIIAVVSLVSWSRCARDRTVSDGAGKFCMNWLIVKLCQVHRSRSGQT